MITNRVEIEGRIVERSALRYTPGGIPVLECRMAHCSEQMEADASRLVDCEIPLVALGENANWLLSANQPIKVCGFLAARSLKNRQLVLHITTVEFIEGI